MRINFIGNTRIFRLAAMVLLTCGLLQPPVSAEPPVQTSEFVKTGTPVLLGLARGEVLRYTAFNPGAGEGRGESIRMQMKLYDAHGNVIAESAQVVIPPGGFRSVDFRRDDLPLAGEAGTGLLQVRTTPLWGLSSLDRISVSTSYEIRASSAPAGSFKFFYTIEALP